MSARGEGVKALASVSVKNIIVFMNSLRDDADKKVF